MTESAIHPAWMTPAQRIPRPQPNLRPRRARIGALAAIPSPPVPESDPLAELPPVQRAVARLIAEGWLAPDIAGVLGISVHTVENHTHDAYATLGIEAPGHAASRILARMVGAWAGRMAERAKGA